MQFKRPILLYCADAELLSSLAFVLRLHPYEVIAIEGCADAALLAGGSDALFACCVLIHAQQGDMAGRLVYRLLEVATDIPILLVDRAGDLAPVRYADMVLYGRNTSMHHILGALQTLCARKRGPQPRSAA
jgi:hypothetical protein